MTAAQPAWPRVLVVDDDAGERLLTRESLRQGCFAVVEARDGQQALESFQRETPDIVLMDVVMPGMDGFAVCAALRRLPGGAHVPIVMVTGLDDLESIARAYEVGATDFITKPINWLILQHRVRYILRGSTAVQALRRSEANNRALVNANPDAIIRLSADGLVLDMKRGGGFPYLPPGQHLRESLPEETQPPFLAAVRRALQSGTVQMFDCSLTTHGKLAEYEIRAVASAQREVIAIVRDITEKKQAEQRIRFLAYYDSLTGLPNRVLFQERLRLLLAQAERHQRLLAVLFLDLDQFKRINDSLGHRMGDLLLKAFAARLERCLRESDTLARAGDTAHGDMVARLGGDEFIILLGEIRDFRDAARVAERVLASLADPFDLDGYEAFASSSIGVSIYPHDGADVDTLLKHADTAMYHAKEQGRNNYQLYAAWMNSAAVRRLSLENQLRRALERDEFTLHYQPQVDLASGRIVGAEALLRWHSRELGTVPPASFISVAEDTGLIEPLGEWVLHKACAQARAWQRAALPSIRMSVNLSGRQLRKKTLFQTVDTVLQRSGLDAQYLELELTESTIMQDPDAAVEILTRLKKTGVRIAIDDFGTGYSSLSYLLRFPLDTLKIDKSFIKELATDPRNAAIVRSVITLAHHLNLQVIAEGIEFAQQAHLLHAQTRLLQEQGCDLIQGYLIGKPVTAEAFTPLLVQGQIQY